MKATKVHFTEIKVFYCQDVLIIQNHVGSPCAQCSTFVYNRMSGMYSFSLTGGHQDFLKGPCHHWPLLWPHPCIFMHSFIDLQYLMFVWHVSVWCLSGWIFCRFLRQPDRLIHFLSLLFMLLSPGGGSAGTDSTRDQDQTTATPHEVSDWTNRFKVNLLKVNQKSWIDLQMYQKNKIPMRK